MNVLAKIELDFQVLDTGDPRVLMIADNSEWGQIENSPKIIDITLPGEKWENRITHYFKANQINTFNSNTLNLACTTSTELVDLPDGIYTITLTGSPETYTTTRNYLKIDSTQLSLDKLFIEFYTSCKESYKCFKDYVIDIQMLIDGAKACVRYGDTGKAQELLYRAQELIERVKRCKKCK